MIGDDDFGGGGDGDAAIDSRMDAYLSCFETVHGSLSLH